MKELYTVIAFIIFGYALRSCKTIALRKLGALVMLIASGLCFYYLFESVLAGILAMATCEDFRAWNLLGKVMY